MLGERIKACREMQQMSQSELAKKMKVSLFEVRRWERCHDWEVIGTKKLMALEKLFNVSSIVLFGCERYLQCSEFTGGENMDLKDILQKRRAELELTLEDIAVSVGVTKATVQRWESGEIKNIRRDKINALANALHIPATLLLTGGETEMSANTQFIAAKLRECLDYLENGAEIEPVKSVSLKAPPIPANAPQTDNNGKLMFMSKGYEVDLGQTITLSSKAVGIINQVWSKTGLTSTEIIDRMLEYAYENSKFY